ncbi:MAG: YqgE/AlgH family protein [Alphaproteobacteria bacterium]
MTRGTLRRVIAARVRPSAPILALCALAALFGLFVGSGLLAAPDPAESEGSRAGQSLAGRLLVAAPGMDDAHFKDTVILMVRHNDQGALGIIVNKVLGTYPAAEVLREFGSKDVEAAGKIRVHFGGPVGPFIAFVLHSTDYQDDKSQIVAPGIAVTSDKSILERIAKGEGPDRSVVAIGYAGWGPGQLENEIARGSWYIATADPSIVFSDDTESEWSRAVKIGGLDL